MEIIRLPLDELHPYEGNAKLHPAEQIEQIKKSIELFGNNDPIAIWGESNTIVEGHGRYQALRELGAAEAECIRLDHLTDEERRAYGLVHNQLTMNTGFDLDALDVELTQIDALDMGVFDLEFPEDDADGSEAYQTFVDKFKPKLTTDDCYTPPNVYEAVKDWAVREYGLTGEIVRPFYPGGDYQHFDYPDGCVVIDNPPFSILSEICGFYAERNILFFLFAPALTLFSTASGRMNYLPIGATVTYENGAKVSTSFVTNLGPWKLHFSAELYTAVKAADDETRQENRVELANYIYPVEVVNVSANTICKNGRELRIPADDAVFIRALDSQREQKKAIYGGGFLLSEKAAAEKAAAEKAAAEKAAAEKAAAEKAAAEKWELSDREREIVKSLGKRDSDE